MKTIVLFCLTAQLFANVPGTVLAQEKPTVPPPPLTPNAPRVSFLLKNTLGYHRLFRAYGPGIAYGFTMDRRETTPKNWPVGTGLYFSTDGETNGPLILTVTAADEGKTLTTGTHTPAEPRYAAVITPAEANRVPIRLRNSGLLPKRVALISYEPGERGNGTTILTLLPRMSKAFTFPIGTRLYLADDAQVNTVMSGRSIDNGKPFHVVTLGDASGTVDLR
ncbi:hypothetical protein ACAW74_22465 [Fibrella sp. WM1]|uniref:hypothetical protein n=1 Tax=Fibrella musci TaxID=3242485 RepID=UPI00351F9076